MMFGQKGDRISAGKAKLMLHEGDSAVLVCDLSEYGLKRGDVGTVVLVHERKG